MDRSKAALKALHYAARLYTYGRSGDNPGAADAELQLAAVEYVAARLADAGVLTDVIATIRKTGAL